MWKRSERSFATLSTWPLGSEIEREPLDFKKLYTFGVKERTLVIIRENLKKCKIAFPDWFSQACEKQRLNILARNIILLERTADMLQHFADLGIRSIPYKGIAMLGAVYPLGLRDMSDVDILINRSDMPLAQKSLLEMGYTPLTNIEYFDSNYNTGIYSILYHRKQENFSILVHLHWKIFNSSVATDHERSEIIHSDIWASATAIKFGKSTTFRLSHEHAFILACEHATKHSFDPLIHLVDVFATFKKNLPDFTLAVKTAHKWNLGFPIYICSWILNRMIGISEFSGLETALKPGTACVENYLIRELLRRNIRGHGLSVLSYLSMAHSLPQKAILLYFTFFPDANSMKILGKDASTLGYISRGIKSAKLLAGTLTR